MLNQVWKIKKFQKNFSKNALDKLKNNGILESVLKWNEDKMKLFFNNIYSIIIMAAIIIIGCGTAGCCCWEKWNKHLHLSAMTGRWEVFLWRNFQQDQKNEYDNLQQQHLQTSGTLCVRKLCRVHCRCHYYFCYYEQLNGKTVDITDEVPFELPTTWSWCRFSTLVNFVMGKTPARSQKEFWDMPFLPWVSIADMIPGGVIKKTKEFISSNALSHCFSDRISPAGTLIMSFKLTIGRVSILNMPAQHNEAIISIFPFVDQENIHRDYLLKILPVMVDFVKKSPAIKGNTLNSDSLSKMLIPLPPLAEQERIVSCIAQFETILKSIQE